MRIIDNIIFRQYAGCARGLPIFRILFATYILLGVLPRYEWISDFPDAFFYPPLGPALFFSGFPPAWFFYAIEVGIAVAAVALLVGRRVHLSLVAIGSLLLVGNLWAYSFGKINHDILLIATAFALAFSQRIGGPLGECDKAPPQTTREAAGDGWPVALLAMMLGLAMLAAAAPKIGSGWLDPSLPAAYRHLLINEFIFDRSGFASDLLVDFDHLWFWKAADYGTVLLEVGFVFAVAHRRVFQFFCALAAYFHLGIYLAMDLAFVSTLPAYAVFVNWSILLRNDTCAGVAEKLDQLFASISWMHILIIAVAIYTCSILTSSPWGRQVSVTVLVLGSAVGTWYLLWCWRRLLSRCWRQGPGTGD